MVPVPHGVRTGLSGESLLPCAFVSWFPPNGGAPVTRGRGPPFRAGEPRHRMTAGAVAYSRRGESMTAFSAFLLASRNSSRLVLGLGARRPGTGRGPQKRIDN